MHILQSTTFLVVSVLAFGGGPPHTSSSSNGSITSSLPSSAATVEIVDNELEGRRRGNSLVVSGVNGDAKKKTKAKKPVKHYYDKLVFFDEFDYTGLPDPNKWYYDTNENPYWWFNDEVQYYASKRAANSYVSDGSLKITARKEKLTFEPDYGGQNYSSARLVTKNLASWDHGYLEVSAKMPCNLGTWPGIWMLGYGKWPLCGEVDIVEHNGRNPNKVSGTFHTAETVETKGHHGSSKTIKLPTACSQFHKYTLNWTESELIIGVDGHPYNTFKKTGDSEQAWPFDNPHYLIMNLALGGTEGGDEIGHLPATLEVEYVRVYQ